VGIPSLPNNNNNYSGGMIMLGIRTIQKPATLMTDPSRRQVVKSSHESDRLMADGKSLYHELRAVTFREVEEFHKNNSK
jgi:hypothetical protein